MRQPPWFPADVLHVYSDGRLDVAVGGRRQVVNAFPELADAELKPGDEVFLDQELSAAVLRNGESRRTGVVSVVDEVVDEHVILRGNGDEQFVARCAPGLTATLRAGDRVLYKRETQCVLARLPQRTGSHHLLEELPPGRFSDIGGLDDVIADIRRDLNLHLLRGDLVARYHLTLMRGITLVGPPGTGKTMIAGGIANYLRETHPDTRFFHVKPGALRGMYYGESEARIRELFGTARRAPGLVAIFFDELETYGARGSGPGQDIDGRVLGAILAEIDGLGRSGKILCIGATNRLDLCDEAMVREGRFKDRVYHVGRPGREATRQILRRYLTDDLPYGQGESVETVVEAAIGHLFAEQGGAGSVATITLANGERQRVTAPAVLSGALLASAVERAKHVAADREEAPDGGLCVSDVLTALDQALSAEADKLKAPHAARRILDLPGAADIARVEIPNQRRPRRYRYLRAA
jgi:proteasome-associated ATPase